MDDDIRKLMREIVEIVKKHIDSESGPREKHVAELEVLFKLFIAEFERQTRASKDD